MMPTRPRGKALGSAQRGFCLPLAGCVLTASCTGNAAVSPQQSMERSRSRPPARVADAEADSPDAVRRGRWLQGRRGLYVYCSTAIKTVYFKNKIFYARRHC
uniref:Uncharacterized protein n=1 Tax=Arundo donax TaxID=35708 RepID=A0A0A9Q8E9_ARUDO